MQNLERIVSITFSYCVTNHKPKYHKQLQPLAQ